MSGNKPIKIEKIKISPKRMLYVKLWGPTYHTEYGMTRSSIEIQEAKFSDGKNVSYSTPIRIPCNGSAALLSSIVTHYIVEGRQLNTEKKRKQLSSEASTLEINQNEIQQAQISGVNLKSLLLSEFKGKKLSKTRILNTLQENAGIEIENNQLMGTLESLATDSKITKESATHSASGTKYYLWGFPN